MIVCVCVLQSHINICVDGSSLTTLQTIVFWSYMIVPNGDNMLDFMLSLTGSTAFTFIACDCANQLLCDHVQFQRLTNTRLLK